MNSTTCTPEQRGDIAQLYAAVQSNPPDKQTIIKVMANTFISGMTAQERLTAQEREGRESGSEAGRGDLEIPVTGTEGGGIK